MNFVEINKDLNHSLISLSSQQLQKIRSMISSDSKFLEKHGLMDYSLLLVIEQLEYDRLTNDKRNTFFSPKKAYHIGIIDFLQDWSWEKKVEAWWKGATKTISAVPPHFYQTRFHQFLGTQVFVGEKKLIL